jgi:AbrB family looped-hinge helix DNA binding protein
MENVNTHEFWNCRLDTSGRIVLPQPIRAEKHLNHGDELVLTLEDGAIVLRSYEEAMQKLQDSFCANIPRDKRLVDELIAERRAEAKREERR